MNVKRITDADIYRDGGSYGFFFESDDGREYEFFLRTRAFESAPTETHQPPVIYLGDVNGGKEVTRLSWAEAKAFVAPLRYESDRFKELVNIVMTEGQPC